MISRTDAISQINNDISFIPSKMLEDKNRTVGEMLEDVEANGTTTVTEGEIACLLSDNTAADILSEINVLEIKYNGKASEIDIISQPYQKGRFHGKLEALSKIKEIIGKLPPETTQTTIISRKNIREAEKFLHIRGIESVEEVKSLLEELGKILFGVSFYQNTRQTVNVSIEPVKSP